MQELLRPRNLTRQLLTNRPPEVLDQFEARFQTRLDKRERKPQSTLGLAPRVPLQAMAQAVARLEQVAGEVNAQMRAALERLLKSDAEHLTPDDIEDAVKRVSRVAVTSTVEARRMALATATTVDKFNRRDVRRTIGIDVPEYSGPLGEKWRREHIALIKSLPEDAKTRFISVLRDASKKQTRVETIAKALEENEGITHRRARLIARDQVLTLNAKLNRDRHQKAGIEEYEWLTVHDGSVRSNHSDLHGKRFRYDKPPMGGGTRDDEPGNPGDGIGCRCQAIPVIPEFETKPKANAIARPAPRLVRVPSASIPAAPGVEKHIPVAPAPLVAPPVSLQRLPAVKPYQRTAPPRHLHAVSDKVNVLATEAERDAISAFTGDEYTDIREAELKGADNHLADKSKEIQKLLRKAEAEGHAYEGTVYRGIADIPEDVVKSFATPDSVIDMRGTASSSTSLAVSESFAKLDRDFETNGLIEPTTSSGWSVMFRIKNKRGIPIMTMSSSGVLENEVMQPLGAKFRVLGASRPEGTSRVLYVDVEGL